MNKAGPVITDHIWERTKGIVEEKQASREQDTQAYKIRVFRNRIFEMAQVTEAQVQARRNNDDQVPPVTLATWEELSYILHALYPLSIYLTDQEASYAVKRRELHEELIARLKAKFKTGELPRGQVFRVQDDEGEFTEVTDDEEKKH